MFARILTVAAVAGALLLEGCAIIPTNASTNGRLAEAKEGKKEGKKVPQASFRIRESRKAGPEPRVLVLLALSGGGLRAAYFSARTMFALRRVPGPDGKPIDVLKDVDLISSVSGGSLAAAYYASTYDPSDKDKPFGRRVWNEGTVTDLMSTNYINRWFWNWFWPQNILRFWFTYYDRTDIMADTFADNFFDNRVSTINLDMSDLNPARPNLVLNATVGGRSYGRDRGQARTKRFGSVFTFTEEDFSAKLNSDVGSYELARAVMASATFPAAFNYMTLEDFHAPECLDHEGKCYLHLFDGGNSDNLGLVSLKRVLLGDFAAAVKKYDRIVVILVDAFRESLGANPASPNPRKLMDYFVDTNFLDATDSLLEANRGRILNDFRSRDIANYSEPEECERHNLPDDTCTGSETWRLRNGPTKEQLARDLTSKMYFFHVTFNAVTDPENRARLNSIPTTFSLEEHEMDTIRKGVDNIFSAANRYTYACVQLLGAIMAGAGSAPAALSGNPWCGVEPVKEKGGAQRR